MRYAGTINGRQDLQERVKLRTWEEFFESCMRTAQDGADFGSGLAEECGELIGLWKRVKVQGRAVKRIDVIREAGDVLWYLAACRLYNLEPHKNVAAYTRDYPVWMRLHMDVGQVFANLVNWNRKWPVCYVIESILAVVRDITGDTITDEELLSEILLENEMKLARRHPNGFAPENR